jgi:two-component sensor histidine kinase
MPPSTATRERSVSRHYDPDLTAPKQARNAVIRALFRWGLGDLADLGTLILSELVTNAVCHGAGPVSIRILHNDDYLYMEVHDDGPGRPVWRQAGAEAESGRGLVLIKDLIELNGGSLGVVQDAEGNGKTVWVSVRLEGAQ